MTQAPPPPEFEPGGNRIMIVIALIIASALGGMLWSFLSRQNAPREAPAIKARHLPPSAQPEASKPAEKTSAPTATPTPQR